MSFLRMLLPLSAAALLVAATGAYADDPPAATPTPPAAAEPAKAPDALVLYFDLGSAEIRPQDVSLLDQASRLFRDGNPLVMIVSGATDLTGAASANLRLSQERAYTVFQGLVARGIPAERFQVLAKGESAPAVPTPKGVAEERNRRVEISWR